jgi:protein O-mannosyl-transferase
MTLETLTIPAESTFDPAPPAPKSRARWLAIAALIVGALAAYHNTLSLPFVFDDQIVVVDNTTIRDLRAWRDVLRAPHDGSGAAGRPMLNLTFALNYAWGGLDVRGYHVVNLLLHTSSALLLFALVRRTLQLPRLNSRYGPHALPLALAVALLWELHPLNTESVTCISQRTELLVAFFYLLTLLALVRSAEGPARNRWQVLAVASCLIGMASKEVMATMPLVALLFDRTFIAGTFREAWRQRRPLYLGLMGTWLLLGALVLGMGGSRGVAAGFGLGVTPWSYALKQCEASSVKRSSTTFDSPRGRTRSLSITARM